jgi:carbon-monoxide dehydrogenase medium subunit
VGSRRYRGGRQGASDRWCLLVKPAPFDYHVAESVSDVVGLLTALGDGAKVLAGGQSLVALLNLRLAKFDALVDIGRVDALRHIERADGVVAVGAMVRQCDVEEDATLAASVPLLAAATPLIGHFQIRSRGTVGGSIAHADPAAEYPAVALALDAELEIAGPRGTRTVTAAEFFTGMWSTALEADELLVAVRFPVWPGVSGFAVEEVARRHGDFAIAGAAVGVTVADGHVTRATVALFAMAGTPIRSAAAEAALVGRSVAAANSRELGVLATESLEPPEDIHASTELRRRIGATVVARAVDRAIKEAANG